MYTKELRIGVIGNVDSAKSTTISCLSNNILDNGKGYARSFILRHKHEKISGKTSTITQYFTLIDKKSICFIDLAGHSKYLKTTIQGLCGYYIDYAMITIGSDRGIIGTSKEHLGLAISLNIPFLIVITKIDICPIHKLNNILKNIINLMKTKNAGCRKCLLINNNSNIKNESLNVLENNKNVILNSEKINNFLYKNICPIFLISNTKGYNLNILKKFIYKLQPLKKFTNSGLNTIFTIDDIFNIKHVGLVLSGTVNDGEISMNDELLLGPFKFGNINKWLKIIVKSIHNNFKKNVEIITLGSNGCINVKFNKKNKLNIGNVRKGMVLIKNPISVREFEARLTILHHATLIKIGYEPIIHCGLSKQSAKILKMSKQFLKTGDTAIIKFRFLFYSDYITKGSKIIVREGKTKGIGEIINIF